MTEGRLVREAIASQAGVWATGVEVAGGLALPEPILCLGSGTSCYLAEVVAFLGQRVGRRMEAAPTQDFILEPEAMAQRYASVLLLSRSGTTTEVLWAVELAKARGLETWAVSCEPESPLMATCGGGWAVPAGHDHTVVMTRSFSALLLLLEKALAAGRPEVQEALGRLVDRAGPLVEAAEALADTLTEPLPRRLYILGAGARWGIAREGALKAFEMANQNAYAYGPLEFRHGPWGSVTPEDLVVMLGQEAYRTHEQAVVRDLWGRTRRIVTVASAGWFREGGIPGERWVLPAVTHDEWWGPLAVVLLQWLGWHWAIKTGRDPDHPKDLTAVVELSDGATG
ncbi:MAG: SIS domain-containing protein [Firmicutes bacterium]|nr:SIS domain-containing protein [Bacillota bacterium]MCY0898530.1 SIS domain-containing protein [Bacillota bacterium]